MLTCSSHHTEDAHGPFYTKKWLFHCLLLLHNPFIMLGGIKFLWISWAMTIMWPFVCNPPHYPLVMKIYVVQLVAVWWIRIIPVVTGQTYYFCIIMYLKKLISFCYIPPILNLVCGDTSVNYLAVYIVSVEFILVPFLLIIVFYGKITSNILRLSSTEARSKFSTCTSHVIVVVLFYGTVIITYAQPKPNQLQSMGKLLFPFLHHFDSSVDSYYICTEE